MPADQQAPLHSARHQLAQLIADIREKHEADSHLLPQLEALLQQLDQLNEHDYLTGALNRRALLNQLGNELARSYRTGHTFTLAIVSVDHLEQILDSHGQETARAILRQFALEFSRLLRTLDVFGRTAANEFAIIMPTTWLDQSRKAIVRIRSGLDQYDWAAIAPGYQLHFSTGLTINQLHDTPEAMMTRAQTALRNARLQGAGQVAELEPELPPFSGQED
ncbi:GGDEF domain-containing protein [Undibacterium luofuense]|uniref:diguanylate cyclase n=1 Tax=Undibacterium luofuense TaxID=2828733 RepID=A0A941DI89_9BURK|nr:GGDEF domain-containing protein [Undibacterium luofuense]MBR7780539.1 GGDEF domain-containing protein [Undibacterium luofuense]